MKQAYIISRGAEELKLRSLHSRASLYEEIGRPQMELEWVKRLRVSAEEKRRWIDPGHPELSIRRQCVLLGLSRASYYYEPAQDSPEDLALMRCIDAQCTRTPFYGSRWMTVCLYEQGYGVNRKRVQRLMRRMGLWGSRLGRARAAPTPRTGSIRTFCAMWWWSVPTRGGAPTSPTSRCGRASCFWWPSSIGTAATCCPLGSRTRSIPCSAWRRSRRP